MIEIGRFRKIYGAVIYDITNVAVIYDRFLPLEETIETGMKQKMVIEMKYTRNIPAGIR